MSEPILIVFAWTFITAMWLMIIVPYVCGRSDLMTAWNLFLAGSSLFVGYSIINSTYSMHFIQYTSLDYYRYCLGGTVFYLVITLVYYRFKLPRKLSGKILQKWPPAKPAVLFFMIPLAMLFMAGLLFPGLFNVPFVKQVMTFFSGPSLILATSFAFAAWYKQRANPILFFVFLITATIVMIFLIRYAPTRRPFLGFMVSFPMVIYWMRWRYRKPIVVLPIAATFALITILAVSAYTEGRWEKKAKSFAETLEVAKDKLDLMVSPDWNNVQRLLRQDTAECSLLAIHMYTYDKKPEYFHSLYWMAVNPIPRVFWENKPEALGATLPLDGRSIYGMFRVYISKKYNWGPGIIGHGYHDGGLIALVVYAILFGTFLRLIDELLMSQPGNPYLIGGVSSFAGEIIAWSRGDIGGFSMIIIAAIVVTWLICRIGRLIYGTGLVYPRPVNNNVLLVKKISTTCSKPVS